MHLTPVTKPLLSVMEAAVELFYRYVFGKCAEHHKGECEFLSNHRPKTGESNLAENARET